MPPATGPHRAATAQATATAVTPGTPRKRPASVWAAGTKMAASTTRPASSTSGRPRRDRPKRSQST